MRVFFITAIVAGLTFGNGQNDNQDKSNSADITQMTAIEAQNDLIDDMNRRYNGTCKYVGRNRR